MKKIKREQVRSRKENKRMKKITREQRASEEPLTRALFLGRLSRLPLLLGGRAALLGEGAAEGQGLFGGARC